MSFKLSRYWTEQKKKKKFKADITNAFKELKETKLKELK